MQGQPLSLEPKPLNLLLLLLRTPNELVTKEEIFEALWTGRVVDESVLTRCVAKLRSVLGDANLIRTQHGYGYCLAAEVRLERIAAASPSFSEIRAGDAPAQRPHWKLLRALDARGLTWLAEHEKSRDLRVYKFALDEVGLSALRREVTVDRLLRALRPDAQDCLRLMDWQLDEVPFYLELPYFPLGSLQHWLAAQGGAKKLPLAQRIELAAQAAEALGAAHAVGVLHKDLKPSNLLMESTDAGERLRLVDFGQAQVSPEQMAALKLTRLGEEAQGGSPSGTPHYLAPELFSGTAPSIKSDVFSLGVLLYQLVVGDVERPLAPGWEREVEDELLRADIADCCDTDPALRLGDAGALARRLRSLDARRQALAQRRAQAAESERLRHYYAQVQRRRRLAGAATGVLLIALGVSGVMYARLLKEHDRAEDATRTAEAINRFLNEDVLAAADPYTPGGGRGMTMGAVLDKARLRLAEHLNDAPLVQAELAHTLAVAYQNLGDETGARPLLESALEKAVAVDADAPLANRLRAQLGDLSLAQSRFEEGLAHYRAAYTSALRVHGARHPLTLEARMGLGWAVFEQGHFEDSARELEAAYADARTLGPEGHAVLHDIGWNLAETYAELHRWKDAEQLMDDGLRWQREEGQSGSTLYLWREVTLGMLWHMQADYARSDALFARVAQTAASSLDQRHGIGLTSRHYLALSLLKRGLVEEALAAFRVIAAERAALHGADSHYTRFSEARVGESLSALGQHEEALALLGRAHAASQARLGERHPHSVDLQRLYGDALRAAGDLAQAERLLTSALRSGEALLPANNNRLAWLQKNLAELREAQSQVTKASEHYAAAARIWTQAFGAGHPYTRQAQANQQRLLVSIKPLPLMAQGLE